MTTADLSKFGKRELLEARDLIDALIEGKVPENFNPSDNLEIMFNQNSGYVFLTDGDFKVWMLAEGKIEEFYSCPICGTEGFCEDIKEHSNDPECAEWVKSLEIEEN